MWIDYNDKFAVSSEGDVFNKEFNRIVIGSINNKGYIRITMSKGKTMMLHTLVGKLFLPRIEINGLMIDHINRNKLDNRACNLRWVSSSINNLNRGIPKNNLIQEKNIHFRQKRNTYEVRFKQQYFGSFKTLEEAKKCRDSVLNAVSH